MVTSSRIATFSGLALALGLALGVRAAGPQGETGGAPTDQEPEPATAVALDQARGATRALVETLIGRLQDEIEAGGLASAVSVCSEEALALTAAQNREGLAIRRVSTRLRNPANRPDEYELRGLDDLAQAHSAGTLPPERWEVVEEQGRRELRYLRPIQIVPLCLGCHGATADLDPGVLAQVRALYPADEATGYALGDLRGAVSVRVALPPRP
jgi:hypothetical protein